MWSPSLPLAVEKNTCHWRKCFRTFSEPFLQYKQLQDQYLDKPTACTYFLKVTIILPTCMYLTTYTTLGTAVRLEKIIISGAREFTSYPFSTTNNETATEQPWVIAFSWMYSILWWSTDILLSWKLDAHTISLSVTPPTVLSIDVS